jgi:steroid 5-alpha reductase family enzyme
MTPWQQLLALAVLMVIIMSAGWDWQRRHHNAGIVDVLWSLGLGLGALWIGLTGRGAPVPRITVACLGAAWSLRLALHLWRRVRHEHEDGRYSQLRSHWNGHQGKFFAFFQFQALLVVLFSLPFLSVAANPVTAITTWMAVGAGIWVVSLMGESLADRQLAIFRADSANQGKTCQIGMWRYSRHPNYFFEWLHWFSYVALAIGSPIGWLAWSGPVVMYVFLRWISGVPFTEAQALRSRGDDYRRYQRRTPMFFPWFPKSTN